MLIIQHDRVHKDISGTRQFFPFFFTGRGAIEPCKLLKLPERQDTFLRHYREIGRWVQAYRTRYA